MASFAAQPKSVLFYSRDCQHSAVAVRAASTRPDLIALLCVDDIRGQVPSCVDRVPMLLTSDRRLLADGDLFAFLEGRPTLQQQQQWQKQQHSQAQQQQAQVDQWQQQQQQPQNQRIVPPQQQQGQHQEAGPEAAHGGGTAAFSWIGEKMSGAVDSDSGSLPYLAIEGTDNFPQLYVPPDEHQSQGQNQSQQQRQQEQQQQLRYQPLNVHPAPDIPGRGMVAMPLASQQGDPPPRLMPAASSHNNRQQGGGPQQQQQQAGGGGGEASLESLQAARELELGRWTGRNPGQPT